MQDHPFHGRSLAAYNGGTFTMQGAAYVIEGTIGRVDTFVDKKGRPLYVFVLKDARQRRGAKEWEPYPHADYVAAIGDYAFAVGDRDLVMTSDKLKVTITLSSCG